MATLSRSIVSGGMGLPSRHVWVKIHPGTYDYTAAHESGHGFGLGHVDACAVLLEFLDDVDSDPRVAEIPGVPLEHNAMLAIPLVGGEGVMGVLELYRPRGKLFTQSDLDAGMLFAQQASGCCQPGGMTSSRSRQTSSGVRSMSAVRSWT